MLIKSYTLAVYIDFFGFSYCNNRVLFDFQSIYFSFEHLSIDYLAVEIG
jgi:hypothetical protein